jgi:DNA-binding transcriptional LysR family regulator
MLTLRQIEVIRAILVTGTVGGAARLLNVSSPGISRVMKHAEAVTGIRLFSREAGRYVATREAAAIFRQINDVYTKVEDLRFVMSRMARGAGADLKLGSVPSIGHVMVPRAIADVRRAFPSLLIDVDILKIEETIDYLLLGKGEVVAISYQIDHPLLTLEPLALGRLKCIVPVGHRLARRAQVAVADIVKYKLIGIDPGDPYGRIMANLFASQSLPYEVTIRARFGFTVCALVAADLGIAVIDEFTLAGGNWPTLQVLDIAEATTFQTYVAYRKDAALSSYAAQFITNLRQQMKRTGRPARRARKLT